MKRNKKAFTLIELVSVLVILAILALIVTPLVLNIIRKARISADKRSIDAYGRSVELAIADYLLDTGNFPTSIEQLTIEYSGDTVSCSTTQLNSDSSVYLAGCTVRNRAVEGYTYGKEETVTYDVYSVGDEVTYNNVDYYVIANSDATESSVTLLKAEPLTVEEVNEYGVGHINRYLYEYQGTAYDENGYGGMAYYSSATCGYNGSDLVYDGCTTDYSQSEVKYAVDAWKTAQAPAAIEARLIEYDELLDNLGYDPTISSAGQIKLNENVPNWVYNNNYSYWTMTQKETYHISYVRRDGWIEGSAIWETRKQIRPVIVLSKSALN